MTPTELEHRLRVAEAVAREAGVLMRRRFLDRSGAGTAFTFKGHQDYLTQTDSEVERLVRKRLNSAFPGDTVIGEEDGGGASERTWVVDPIDGTANFARGVPHFCISIGLISDGEAVIGVIYAPMLDELYVAATGHGATLNGETMRVSTTDRADRARIEIGWSPRRPFEEHIVLVRRAFELGFGIQHGGSGSLGIAYVAAGRSDAFYEVHINSWDVLAGLVLVREAGGRVSDFLAGDGLTKGNAILVATPGIADQVMAATGVTLI